MIVRKMRADDVDGVAFIEKNCFHKPWSAEEIRATFLREDSLFVVAQEKDCLIGYAGMYIVLDEGYITNVAVLSSERQKGVATELLRSLLTFAAEAGAESATLEVRTSNKEAIALYEKQGFESAGIRKNFYEYPSEDGIIMWKYNIL